MAYFPDLSPYSYGHGSHPGVVHVGWLDKVHPYPKGDVDVLLAQKMRLLATRPVELYRGKHICELCEEPPGLIKALSPNGALIDPDCSWWNWIEKRSSNGEIRVSREGVTYAAPLLIIHNIEAHQYLPPEPFLLAVADASA